MNYFNRIKLGSCRPRIALLAAAVFGILSACQDDTFEEFNKTGEEYEYICFNVTDESAGVVSRSTDDVSSVRNIYTLASVDRRDTLYIIESETNGINIGKNAPPQSRGEIIETLTGLTDDIGLYAFSSPEDGGVPAADTPLMFDHWKLRTMKNAPAGMINAKLFDDNGDEQNNVKWPGYPLDFVAYYPRKASFKYTPAPAQEGQGDGTSTETLQFNENDYKDDLYSWMWAPGRNAMCMHPTPRNNMYLYYKVPDSIKNQEDLMAAYVTAQRCSPVPLRMQHLLTAVRFRTGDGMPVCTIKKIALTGVRSSGYMSVMNLVNGNDKALWWENPRMGKAMMILPLT